MVGEKLFRFPPVLMAEHLADLRAGKFARPVTLDSKALESGPRQIAPSIAQSRLGMVRQFQGYTHTKNLAHANEHGNR